MIPLIKFVGNKKIMGSFASSVGQIIFASIFGFGLFALNFIVIGQDGRFTDAGWKDAVLVIFSLLYVALIIKVILEPVQYIREQTDKELHDVEFKKVTVQETSENLAS